MRQDYKIFMDVIKTYSKVIDIGCGEGEFLEMLKQQKSCQVFGIEMESSKVATALSRGVSVIQGDADADLNFYPSKETAPEPFDFLILANSLQVFKNPKDILEHAKRISKKTLISTPNFGYIANRFQFLRKGKMPVTKQLSYEWYDTPNIHFSTLTDFIDLLKEVGFTIEKCYYIDNGGEAKEFDSKNPTIANLFGKEGVFVVS